MPTTDHSDDAARLVQDVLDCKRQANEDDDTACPDCADAAPVLAKRITTLTDALTEAQAERIKAEAERDSAQDAADALLAANILAVNARHAAEAENVRLKEAIRRAMIVGCVYQDDTACAITSGTLAQSILKDAPKE